MRPAIRTAAIGLSAAFLLAAGGGQADRPPSPRDFLDELQPPPGLETPTEHHEFTFARAAYSGGRGWGWGSWTTDYPKADRQFMIGVKRLTRIDAYGGEFAVSLEDPDLGRYPFLYAVEVGRMDLTEGEVLGLRRYLAAGGFLLVDDFWGTWEWAVFEAEIHRVLPGRPIVDLPLDHPVFHTVYDIDEVLQVDGRPLLGAGRLRALLPRHLRRERSALRDGQLELRPRRRLGVGREPLLPSRPIDLRLRARDQRHRLRDDVLSRPCRLARAPDA